MIHPLENIPLEHFSFFFVFDILEVRNKVRADVIGRFEFRGQLLKSFADEAVFNVRLEALDQLVRPTRKWRSMK